MTKFRVYYMRPHSFARFITDTETPTKAELSDTHTFLREVKANDMEHAFMSSQAEEWSPHGEAAPLIRERGLAHTSMSVGDVLETPDHKFYAVASVGFVLME